MMKTAISLPDRLFENTEKTPRLMGMPRSQLFARAQEEFIEHPGHEIVTERLNRVSTQTGIDRPG